MVKVFPFEGIIYNKDKVKKPAAVFAPPYDVISPAEQAELYEANDFNVIRLILGKDFPGDGEYNNRYVRAAAFFNGWLRHKILLKDDKPALYLYQHTFSYHGKKFVRLGFVSLLRLEDLGHGKVFPHEETYPKAKLDRLQLLRTTHSNLESIFALYSDEKGKIVKVLKSFMKRKPLFEAKDKAGVTHRLWRIDKKPAITKIMQEMKDKAVFIADGHHRYEASLRFRAESKTKNTKFSEDESYNHIMTYFTPLEDKGLLVLPIHRVVGRLNYFDPIRFEQDLGIFFDVKPYPANKKTAHSVLKKLMRDVEKAEREKHALGLYLGKHRFFLLTLRSEESVEELVAEEKPKAWKKLDVNVLHYVVFDRLLNIARETEDRITYTHDEETAVKMVDEGRATLAFLMNPTRVEEIIAIASKLEKLPHKSTFFYPKLLSGLVFNRFDFNEKVL